MTNHYSLSTKEKGEDLQTWIENHHAPGCPYPISEFSLAPRNPDYAIERTPIRLDSGALAALHLDASTETSGYRKISITRQGEGPPTWWIGRIGPGVLFMDDIFRSTRSEDPHISEFTKAAYELDFPLNSLMHVIVPNVNETDTLSCVKRVYKSHEVIRYPWSEEQTWEPCSSGYKALLGTGIGKIVGAFVLCSWGQGRKRISRIVTFHVKSDVHKLYMRFDLEDI
ncbi:hypothetical protein N7457_009011 [Penicillium paradoxum]|uniref:uncharacterized protein n=1 Tax=Penicillium paradoxum TaxID=176176 RepID=UPI002547EB9A|nr:uncharacterized protein N7457_009011 [Penicillium paradoxum]KAJ5774115.1 hypothetical protein N7457_009011 [Penicillium paradoxum]